MLSALILASLFGVPRSGAADGRPRAEKHREGRNTFELDADGSTGAQPDDRRFRALRAGQDTRIPSLVRERDGGARSMIPC